VGGDESEIDNQGEENIGDGIHLVLLVEWFGCVYDLCWMLLNAAPCWGFLRNVLLDDVNIRRTA